MPKMQKNEAVETEVVETSAAAETVAEVQPVEETVIIPEPEVQTTPEAEVAPVVEVVPEVVAETPKEVPPVMVEQVTPTAKYDRKYKLTGMQQFPPPRGLQRIYAFQIMREFAASGKLEVTPTEMLPRATELNWFASGGVIESIAWHLHQMELKGYVICTNKQTTTTVEQKVTPAQATSPEANTILTALKNPETMKIILAALAAAK
jgi:hypothetical protein